MFGEVSCVEVRKGLNPREIINVIYQSRYYDDVFYKILILDVKKRIGIENGWGLFIKMLKI